MEHQLPKPLTLSSVLADSDFIEKAGHLYNFLCAVDFYNAI